jgi:hypothetical protein
MYIRFILFKWTKKNFAPTYHIDTMFLPVFWMKNAAILADPCTWWIHRQNNMFPSIKITKIGAILWQGIHLSGDSYTDGKNGTLLI